MNSFRIALCCLFICASSLFAEPLPETMPLEGKDDLAMKMVDGIGKYLDRETAASVAKRKQLWKIDTSTPAAYAKSVQANKDRLKKILGVVDERVKFNDIAHLQGIRHSLAGAARSRW
jgi:hypothetical protein